jgi:hypothetical protein
LEFGKSFLILGGLPISRAFLKPAGEAFVLVMVFISFQGANEFILSLTLSLHHAGNGTKNHF